MDQNVFSVLNAAQGWQVARATNGLNEKLLVTVSIAFLIRRLAPLAENSLKSRAVKEQPAFDVRVGSSNQHRGRRICNTHFPPALVQAFAVGVGGNDNQVRPRTALEPQITQVVFQLRDNFAVASDCIPPVESYSDIALVGNPLNKRTDNLYMR